MPLPTWLLLSVALSFAACVLILVNMLVASFFASPASASLPPLSATRGAGAAPASFRFTAASLEKPYVSEAMRRYIVEGCMRL
eukprot:3124582-Pleurochrysis_carterae.AAC.2